MHTQAAVSASQQAWEIAAAFSDSTFALIVLASFWGIFPSQIDRRLRLPATNRIVRLPDLSLAKLAICIYLSVRSQSDFFLDASKHY
ncbi:MAG: hypothetical protein C0485_03625 [Pirellula sp.]|nr:hypothetical protein [Pirellula sp.]